MSNYEKEMEEACEKWVKSSRVFRKVWTPLDDFKAGAKWQASRLTEEKILKILIEYKCKNLNSITREIVSLLKGEDEK